MIIKKTKISEVAQYQNQLLTAGIIAGVLVLALSWGIAYLSEGFDVARHANSQLVLGEWGWLQTLNFITYGLLVTAAAIGAHYAMKGRPGGTGAPLLMAIYGIGGIIVGFAPTDPAFGFPPGTDTAFAGYAAISTSAQIHGIAGGIGFTAIAIACFFFARYFMSLRQRVWAGLSFCIGLSVFVVTAYLVVSSGGEISSFNYLPIWIVGSLLWLYVSLVSWKLRQSSTVMSQDQPGELTLPEQISSDMRAAMKRRDATTANTLKSLLARISNAEAVDSSHLDTTKITEVSRKQLSQSDIDSIIDAEIAELESALTQLGGSESNYKTELQEKITLISKYRAQ